MSYDVDEGVQDAEEHLVFLKLLKETYPDAHRNARRWESSTLSFEDCDGIDLRVDDHLSKESPFIYAQMYRTLGTGRVYRSWGRVMLNTFFSDLKTQDADFYQQLLVKLRLATKS